MNEAATGTSAKSEILKKQKMRIPANNDPTIDLVYELQEEVIDSTVDCYVLPSFLGSRIPQSPF